jgi:ribosomal protein L6P/L9E
MLNAVYYIFFYRTILESHFGYRLRIFVKGVGFSVRVENFQLILNVGASSCIKKKIYLNFLFRVLGRKQNILSIYGGSYQKLKNFIDELINLRKINSYTGKGILYYKEIKKLKIGKVTKI